MHCLNPIMVLKLKTSFKVQPLCLGVRIGCCYVHVSSMCVLCIGLAKKVSGRQTSDKGWDQQYKHKSKNSVTLWRCVCGFCIFSTTKQVPLHYNFIWYNRKLQYFPLLSPLHNFIKSCCVSKKASYHRHIYSHIYGGALGAIYNLASCLRTQNYKLLHVLLISTYIGYRI